MRKSTALLGLSFISTVGLGLVALSASAGPAARHRAPWGERISHGPNGEEAAPGDLGTASTLSTIVEDGTADGGAADASSDVALPGRVPYNGGVIVSQAEVAAVLWGSGVDPAVSRNIGTFYGALMHGAFMHFLSEYATPTQTLGSYGSYLGTFRIEPAQTSGTITDADIQTELTNQIARGSLPAPDANTIYMLHLPPGITVQGPNGIGLSCVDYCSYHFSNFNIGLNYAVVPDQSGGCAPGPVGCDQNPNIHCCGDRSAFDNLTKTASHELMEAITDPQPFMPAWSDVLGVGEIADFCNFSRVGDNAYTSIVAENGETFQAQRGFSNAAFFVGLGAPRGCVNYPTTLCCQQPVPADLASLPPPAACTWMGSGVTSCPKGSGQLTVGLDTIGGFGSGSIALSADVPYDGECFPADDAGVPTFCATVTGQGLTAEPTAKVTVPATSSIPLVESCYGPPVGGVCPAFAAANVNGSCCALPPAPFVVSGTTQTALVGVANVPVVPAVPAHALVLAGLSLFGIGARGRRRRVSSDRRDGERARAD